MYFLKLTKILLVNMQKLSGHNKVSISYSRSKLSAKANRLIIRELYQDFHFDLLNSTLQTETALFPKPRRPPIRLQVVMIQNIIYKRYNEAITVQLQPYIILDRKCALQHIPKICFKCFKLRVYKHLSRSETISTKEQCNVQTITTFIFQEWKCLPQKKEPTQLCYSVWVGHLAYVSCPWSLGQPETGSLSSSSHQRLALYSSWLTSQ